MPQATFPDYSRLIRRLGRNARPLSEDGAGVLDSADAALLWQALLDRAMSVSQEAAVLMGLRVHGESAAMLAAFAEVTEQHLAQQTLGRPCVVLHCTGQARRQPTLAPLLAHGLQKCGVATLIVTHDAFKPSSSTGVLNAMGVVPQPDAAAAAAALARGGLAWLPLTTWCPPLARLIARRTELGFRNSAHSLLKLLTPVRSALMVANYTHPAYRTSFSQALPRLGRTALLIRGTEGDPVIWDSEAHAPLAWCRGVARSVHAVDVPREELPLPAADDAAAAAFAAAVLSGSLPMPAVLEKQIALLQALATTEPQP